MNLNGKEDVTILEELPTEGFIEDELEHLEDARPLEIEGDVPPEVSTPIKKSRSNNFINSFCRTFDMYSLNNGLYGALSAHVLLGQKLKYVRLYFGPIFIDPRVSLFLMQSSGTGKSVAYDMITKISELANLKVRDMDDATDAAIVGTMEPQEEIDPETNTKSVVYVQKLGLLHDSDILHYDEGKMLVSGRNQYAQNTLAYFQKTLNPLGSGQNLITKNMAHGEPIEYHPECSLLITSHDIEQLLQSILDTGFFQRIVFYPRWVPLMLREENEIIRGDRFGKQIVLEGDEEKLAEELNKIEAKYKDWTIKVNNNCYPVIRGEIHKIYEMINSSHERVREIMATFAPRYNNLMYIFAFHHSAVNYKDEIDIEDIRYGANLTKSLFQDVMSWIEENIVLNQLNSRETAVFKSYLQIFNSMDKSQEGYVPKVSFVMNCVRKWGMSQQTVNRHIEKLKGLRKVLEAKGDKGKMIKFEGATIEVKKK